LRRRKKETWRAARRSRQASGFASPMFALQAVGAAYFRGDFTTDGTDCTDGSDFLEKKETKEMKSRIRIEILVVFVSFC